MAYGQQPSQKSGGVEKRLKAIEARLAAIERKMAQFESDNTSEPTTGEPSVRPSKSKRVNWQDRSQWRANLRHGMTKDAVRKLFGEPAKIDEVSDRLTVWFYGYHSGGRISFVDGAVASWREP